MVSIIKRNLPLIIMSIAFVVPMVLAYWGYHHWDKVVVGFSHKGNLLPKGSHTSELHIQTAFQQNFDKSLAGKWHLLVNCEQAHVPQSIQDRWHRFYLALGKTRHRVNVGLVSDKTLSPLTYGLARYQMPTSVANGFFKGKRAVIVDPHGFMVLAYNASHTDSQLLKDFQKLLKVSQVG